MELMAPDGGDAVPGRLLRITPNEQGSLTRVAFFPEWREAPNLAS